MPSEKHREPHGTYVTHHEHRQGPVCIGAGTLKSNFGPPGDWPRPFATYCGLSMSQYSLWHVEAPCLQSVDCDEAGDESGAIVT